MKEEVKLVFFRSGKSYYFKLNNKTFPVNNITIDSLKANVLLPYSVNFYGCSKAVMERILTDLKDKNIDIDVYKVHNDKNNVLKFKAYLYEKKNTIDAYKIPYVNCLYGRVYEVNPYILKIIDGKRILVEVTKDYIKRNNIEYYLLSNQLSNKEKAFFEDCYTKLEYDAMYNLNIDNKEEISNKIKKIK